MSHLISIVIPVFNEAATLHALSERLDSLIQSQPEMLRFEAIYVNDGSKDSSEAVLTELGSRYSWLNILHLSRNFGHQLATSAGIDYATGDAVILMDGDLQDPPELIPQMIHEWLENDFDVVYAVREKRDGESWFKKATAATFYRLLDMISDINIPVDTGDFRLMSRPVVDALTKMREKNRYLRGMVSWIGFRQTAVYYERDKRFEGKTKFSVLKMWRYATDGLLSFSKKPLEWIMNMGFIFSALSFLGILVVLYKTLIEHRTVPGWSSLMVVVLFIGGIQLICMGMIGEYVARIFDEVRNRPLYLIRKIEGQRTSRLMPNNE